MNRYECSVWLPAKRQEVFDYFADARNLDAMTPDWFRLEIRCPDPPIRMARGTTIDYRMRWRSIPMRWRSEITEWDPDRLFTYEQRRGPYRVWVHEHRYSDRDGGTLVEDRVEYATLLGSRLDRRWVGPDVERIFEHRNAYVTSLFAPSRAHSPIA